MSDSDSNQEAPPRIKVTDRRLFDSDGNFRTDGPEPDSDETASAAADPATATEPSEPPLPSAPAAEVGVPAEPAPQPPEPEPVATRAAASEPPPPEVRGVVADAPAGPAAGNPPGRPGELPRDLGGFIESQYYETLLYLGAIPHPQTGQAVEDLELAQYKIDLLSMLQEKTEGNRTAEESKLLDDVLYQLRMLFLQKRKVAKL